MSVHTYRTYLFLKQLFKEYYTLFNEPMPVDIFNLRLYFSAQSVDLDTFKSEVIDFRNWISDVQLGRGVSYNYNNSELWLTGYGLADQSATAALAGQAMQEWTDWLSGYSDQDIFNQQLGPADDDYRLVQRWSWMPFDDQRDMFSATRLFSDQETLTPLGVKYSEYTLHTPEPASMFVFLTAAILATNAKRTTRLLP